MSKRPNFEASLEILRKGLEENTWADNINAIRMMVDIMENKRDIWDLTAKVEKLENNS